jgi:hypothetical protein
LNASGLSSDTNVQFARKSDAALVADAENRSRHGIN